jgi:oxaloacetate decarboxylase alpha subunit/pyruvate carboxylase subunit B
VGVQAVKNVLLKNQGEEPYSSCTDQYIKLVRGEYGQTPAPINPEFRKKITGSPEETRFDTSTWKNTEAPEGHVKDIKDQMLLDLFPAVALKFLQNREETTARNQSEMMKNQEYERLASAVSGNYLE